ncbi:MAG: hypothetical protein MHM6MM_006710 [Cercozoa sp. M6MM]
MSTAVTRRRRRARLEQLDFGVSDEVLETGQDVMDRIEAEISSLDGIAADIKERLEDLAQEKRLLHSVLHQIRHEERPEDEEEEPESVESMRDWLRKRALPFTEESARDAKLSLPPELLLLLPHYDPEQLTGAPQLPSYDIANLGLDDALNAEINQVLKTSQ